MREVQLDIADDTVPISVAQTGGAVRIESMARELGIGRRQLERLFKLQVGVGPKEFASLARFGAALRRIDGATAWTDVAAAAGYADQAHFIRNFKRRSGLTPTEYRQLLSSSAPR